VSLGCSGTTWLGGKLVFFISCLFAARVSTSLPSARRGAVALYTGSMSLCSGRMAFGAIRTAFEASSPPIDQPRGKVLRVEVKAPPPTTSYFSVGGVARSGVFKDAKTPVRTRCVANFETRPSDQSCLAS